MAPSVIGQLYVLPTSLVILLSFSGTDAGQVLSKSYELNLDDANTYDLRASKRDRTSKSKVKNYCYRCALIKIKKGGRHKSDHRQMIDDWRNRRGKIILF
ncbi:hypothetical protein H4582DRAFT_1380778 [Lactarius indigo]|nr:hypothetical protein H4582DRAFT_304879 [Lactarius indigo]KAI9441414.1 hypothetical protein H4582DRAFT_1380778 [Lactarius indigo]